MLNLIRMNLYRMARTKSMYILLFFIGLFCISSCFMQRIDYLETEKIEQNMPADSGSHTDTDSQTNPNDDTAPANNTDSTGVMGITVSENKTEESGDTFHGNFGIYVHVPEGKDGKHPTFLEYYQADLASGIIVVFLIIGCALYVNGEFKCGFIKNIAGQTRHKSYIYISKVAALAFYVAVSMLFYGLVQYISLKLFLPYDISFGKTHLLHSGKLILATFLLYMAFVSFTALLVTLFRSTSVGITIGLLADFGLFINLSTYLESLFHVKIIKYMIVTNMLQMLPTASHKDILSGICVGGTFLIVYLLLGTTYFTKKDVV